MTDKFPNDMIDYSIPEQPQIDFYQLLQLVNAIEKECNFHILWNANNGNELLIAHCKTTLDYTNQIKNLLMKGSK